MSLVDVGVRIEKIIEDDGTLCYYCVKHCGPYFCMIYALEIYVLLRIFKARLCTMIWVGVLNLAMKHVDVLRVLCVSSCIVLLLLLLLCRILILRHSNNHL